MDKLICIRNIFLEHKGKENKISAKEVAKILNIRDNESCSRTRMLILEAAKMYKLPLAADVHGYYLISTKNEYIRYMRSLEHRMREIEERKEVITENYFRNCDL